MNTKVQYFLLGISAIFLVGIGFILDRVGGFGIRSDDVSSSMTLSFSEPALLGVPYYVRWQGDEQVNIGVILRLVSKEESYVFGLGQLLVGGMFITIPCSLTEPPFRLELKNAITGALLGVSEIDTLPPGPDCVQ
ncbi:MAG: hypothetical protein O3A36_01380 [bacterium]|nr:hypothetical protein [bacterium]